jgi:hypothetical protein
MERTLIALMQRSSSDWPDGAEAEGGAERGAAAVSVDSGMRTRNVVVERMWASTICRA